MTEEQLIVEIFRKIDELVPNLKEEYAWRIREEMITRNEIELLIKWGKLTLYFEPEENPGALD